MRTTLHFTNALKSRTDLTWEELNQQFDSQVYTAGQTCPHKIVRNKMKRYTDQSFVVFPDANLFCAVRADGSLATAMYLDGRWGYKDQPYDPDAHFGRKS